MTYSSYPGWQLAKALQSGSDKRARQWTHVLQGIFSGKLKIGSRAPVSGFPVWVTPEVVRGGFATGEPAAGGALLPHERAMAARRVPHCGDGTLRAELNAWCVTEEGLDWLRGLAVSGHYRIGLPEEGALMAIALLAEKDAYAARIVLEEIAPFFGRLRFYPREVAARRGAGVALSEVGQVREHIRQKKTRADISTQGRVLTVWLPLYDRLVDLLQARLKTGPGADWAAAAERWCLDYVAAGEPVSRRFADPDGAFQRCRRGLLGFLNEGAVAARELAYVRLQVSRHLAVHGTGAERAARRAEQARQQPDVLFSALTKVLLERLKDLPAEEGLDVPEIYLTPIHAQEAGPGVPEGAGLPEVYRRAVIRAQLADMDTLIEAGHVSSPEVLARLVPALTGQVMAEAYPDRRVGDLVGCIYEAFRRRRTLLLLNFESQVRFREMPWMAALEKVFADTGLASRVAKETLVKLTRQTLTYFPHVPVPNPLIREMQTLAKQAGLDLKLTPELAADIFMDGFTPVFDEAASEASAFFAGRVYGRYYGLASSMAPGSLYQACLQRREDGGGHSVAANGQLIEQQMILTSHNLASLIGVAGADSLDADKLAARCFEDVLRRVKKPASQWHGELIDLKGAAYSWRQMLGFLSLLPEAELADGFAGLQARLEQEDAEIVRRLSPAMRGLENAIAGRPVEAGGGRMFLGWVSGRHPFVRARQDAD